TGMNILVATALVSITANPLLFRLADPAENWLSRRPRLWAMLNRRADRKGRKLNLDAQRAIRQVEDDAQAALPQVKDDAQPATPQNKDDDKLAIVVGYGPVGQQVDRLLREAGIRTVIIDMNIDTV